MKKLVMICGPSGSGKDTLLNMVLRTFSVNDKPFKKIVLDTSRPRREGEVEGVDYFFKDKETCFQKVLSGEAISATEFNSWFYIVDKNRLSEESINIGVFNPEAITQIVEDNIKNEFDILIIYIQASDKNRLLRSLNREENPDVNEILRRFGTDKKDFESFERNILLSDTVYDYVVLNNNLMPEISENAIKISRISKDYFNYKI